MKKSTKTVKAEIYKLLHEYIRLRDGARCLRCGKTERLQLSHIYPKGKYRRMEFDHENLKLLCVGCHLYWFHKNPIEAHEWLEQIMPGRLDKLRLRAQFIDKSPVDYELIKLELKHLIKKGNYEKEF